MTASPITSSGIGVADAVETQLTRLLAATLGRFSPACPALLSCGRRLRRLLIATLDGAHESLLHDGA